MIVRNEGDAEVQFGPQSRAGARFRPIKGMAAVLLTLIINAFEQRMTRLCACTAPGRKHSTACLDRLRDCDFDRHQINRL